MNRNTNKKSLPSLRRIKSKIGVIGVLVIVCTLLSAVTMAYVFTQTEPVVNQFTPSEVNTEIHENFDGTTKNNVVIKNTGDTEAYVRAAIVVTWVKEVTDSSGNKSLETYTGKPVEGRDYNITYGAGNWEKAADGFWYYKVPLAAKAVTTTLIDTCTAVDANTPKGYYLSVEILSSGIQSTPTSVVVEQWSSGVSGVDGTTLKVIAPGSGE